MSTGTIHRLFWQKSFGFVSDTSGTRHFFHRNDTQNFDDLAEGGTVHFDVVTPEPRGPRASNVVRLDPITASETVSQSAAAP